MDGPSTFARLSTLNLLDRPFSGLQKFNFEIFKVIVIEFKQFPKFDPAIFHADVELDARIFSSIEDYITELNIDELCLEDIFIQLLEGKILCV